MVDSLATGIGENQQRSGAVPTRFELGQNYPNPFNPTTNIQFSIPKAGAYSVRVFNILGQEVAKLFDRNTVPGKYTVTFDAGGLSSGLYIYTLAGNDVRFAKKMMLLR
jgi:hypothetical protein